MEATGVGNTIGGAVVVVATHDPQTRDACHRVIDLGPHESAS